MAHWKQNFRFGKELRSWIATDDDAEDYNAAETAAAIVSLIVSGFKHLKHEEFDEISDFIENHEGDADEIRTDPEDFFSPYLEDDADNPEREYVNAILSEFWDICDSERIWVGI